jgi:lipid A 3-O-deacylase
MNTTFALIHNSAFGFRSPHFAVTAARLISRKALIANRFGICSVLLCFGLLAEMKAAEATVSNPDPVVNKSADESITRSGERSIWQSSVGAGFKAGTQTFDVSLAAGFGVAAFGSVQRHDLAWTSISYGRMVGSVRGENRWYQGNWELLGELFGGSQFSPTADWIVGLSPHLRYHFATGTRLVPFVDAGAGVTGTGIHLPDLSTRFEFNTQGGVGVQWFLKDAIALTVESRYVHISNAGIDEPNHGVNTVMGIIGVTWFF